MASVRIGTQNVWMILNGIVDAIDTQTMRAEIEEMLRPEYSYEESEGMRSSPKLYT